VTDVSEIAVIVVSDAVVVVIVVPPASTVEVMVWRKVVPFARGTSRDEAPGSLAGGSWAARAEGAPRRASPRTQVAKVRWTLIGRSPALQKPGGRAGFDEV